MHTRASLQTLNTVQKLADAGRFAAVVEFLSALPTEDVSNSPTLALLLAIAHAQLGQPEPAKRWVTVALARARKRGDRTVEARALNASGGIALATGEIEDAARCFVRALAAAQREDDQGTVGRCSNNLGIIANLRGDYGRAVGSYTMALAAFQQAGLHTGAAETLHNLSITHRERGELVQALQTADRAVHEATEAGDLRLVALTQGGRAETRLLAGDAPVARREIEHALATHREVADVVGEAEDWRVLGCVLGELGNFAEAEQTLRNVVERAEAFGRPLLAAQAERDLARLFLTKLGREDEGSDLARRARARFAKLGAEAEVRGLDQLIATPAT